MNAEKRFERNSIDNKKNVTLWLVTDNIPISFKSITKTRENLSVLHKRFGTVGSVRPVECDTTVEVLQSLQKNLKFLLDIGEFDQPNAHLFLSLRYKLLGPVSNIHEIVGESLRMVDLFRSICLDNSNDTTILKTKIHSNLQKIISNCEDVEVIGSQWTENVGGVVNVSEYNE
jgi:hypothetical protein